MLMSGNSARSRLEIKVEAGYRALFKKAISDKERSVLLSEFPKSGGSWLCEMLSDLTHLDFPRNRFPTSRESIFHGHTLSHDDFKNVVILWRDPRDIMVSWYHHCIIGNKNANEGFIKECRRSFGKNNIHDVKSNMSDFIAWSFEVPPSPHFNWSEFFDYWHLREKIDVRYEDLRCDPFGTLSNLLRRIGFSASHEALEEVIGSHSFENRTGRKVGEEDKSSFARKGIVGDWRNYFDDRAISEITRRVGDRPQKLGYTYE